MNTVVILIWCWLLFFASAAIILKAWQGIKKGSPDRNFDRFLFRILACCSVIAFLIAGYESYRYWSGS